MTGKIVFLAGILPILLKLLLFLKSEIKIYKSIIIINIYKGLKKKVAKVAKMAKMAKYNGKTLFLLIFLAKTAVTILAKWQ